MNISDKMSKWAKLKKQCDGIEAEIQAAVLALGETQEYNGVKATYSKGRGRYDYALMAEKEKADKKFIDLYTEPVTNWKAVCDACELSDSIKQEYYTPEEPSVKLKIVEPETDGNDSDSRVLF
jgi:hypothetical protein